MSSTISPSNVAIFSFTPFSIAFYFSLISSLTYSLFLLMYLVSGWLAPIFPSLIYINCSLALEMLGESWLSDLYERAPLLLGEYPPAIIAFIVFLSFSILFIYAPISLHVFYTLALFCLSSCFSAVTHFSMPLVFSWNTFLVICLLFNYFCSWLFSSAHLFEIAASISSRNCSIIVPSFNRRSLNLFCV